MDLKSRVAFLLLASVLWVLAAKALTGPGTPCAGAGGERGTADFAGEPDFVRDVRGDVAAFVIASF